MPIVVTETFPPSGPVYSSDGALFAGVESVFEYNNLTLNDRSVEDKYRILQIGGLGGADIRDARQVRSGRDGERALSAYYAGRTITLSGRIESLNDHLHGLRSMTTALTGAFADLSEKPLYLNQGLLGGYDTQIMCRPSQPIAITEEIKTWYHYRDFLVTLRASDPRIVSQTEELDQWTADATSYSGEAIFVHENRGNYIADLRITLKGPMTNPSLIVGDDFFGFVGGTTIPTGQEWTINTSTGKVVDVSSTSKFSVVALTSNLPTYNPGANSILFSGTDLVAGTSAVSVAYRHSWI